MAEQKKAGMQVGVRSFLVSIAVIFILMLLSYGLTFIIPGGQYDRIENADGNAVIDTSGEFRPVEGGISFVKWIASPILVLGAEGSGMLIAVIAFLLIIGGAFAAMEACGLMKYMLTRVAAKFEHTRYRLMAVLLLVFMAMGTLIGSFEECVPMVPLVVSLSVTLGWDAVTGLMMSILAAGCGFAAGVFNPFTVGVAQRLAGLPMFSGAWLRAVAFVLIYGLLFSFVYFRARRIEKPVELSDKRFVWDRKMDRALLSFAIILGSGMALVFSSGLIKALQDYTMIIVAVTFLAGGVTATLLTGMKKKEAFSAFLHGLCSMLPAVLMILMASSVKYILEEASILDTILHAAVERAGSLPGWSVILFIYLLVLGMNFFIASGSAKAFMMIPLIVPLAQVFSVSPQLCIMAYAFGDGFSNVFYPTNPALLIGLNLVGVGYGKWAAKSLPFQLCNLLLTALILLLGYAIGY